MAVKEIKRGTDVIALRRLEWHYTFAKAARLRQVLVDETIAVNGEGKLLSWGRSQIRTKNELSQGSPVVSGPSSQGHRIIPLSE